MSAHTPHPHGFHWPTAQGFEELTLSLLLFAGASVTAVMLLLLVIFV
jgi:hypothetical protein